MATIPTIDPISFNSGDTVRWKRADITSAYPGGVLTYTFVGATNPVVTVAATDGTVTLTGTQTTSMVSGRWKYTASVVVSGERTTVAHGYVTVYADPALAGVTDTSSHALRTLLAIEATLESRATESQLDIRLADGRRIMSVSHSELAKFRDLYKGEVRREEDAERLARGEMPKNQLKIRM